MLEACRMGFLPYISESGPMSRGPKAVANMYADNAITASVLLILSSAEIVGSAGAMIVDTMILLKPVAERTSVTVHFFALDQHLSQPYLVMCYYREFFQPTSDYLSRKIRRMQQDMDRSPY